MARDEVVSQRDLAKAALRGEPSYVWRQGQERRLTMILDAFGEVKPGRVLENGCGVGMYVEKLKPHVGMVVGLEYDYERAREAHEGSQHILNAAGENLPFPDGSFDFILSHEVLEHVRDDRAAVAEMVRTLNPGSRMVIFCPNKGYPFETHGFYWHGEYKFGNIPLVNWLPRNMRNKLVPHVRVYRRQDIAVLLSSLPVRLLKHTVIFGAYDNLIARYGLAGRLVRVVLQYLERTPFRFFGLSHFLVIEKENM
jgi:SAM-dependent methyltransferase